MKYFLIGQKLLLMFILGLTFLLVTSNYGKAQSFQGSSLKNATAETALSESDSLVLVALYNATNGPGWTNNTNWLTGPINTWFGITVVADTVTQIRLKNNNLSGLIPAELGQLEKLQVLDLDTNKLTGSIPVELGQLSSLNSLYLNGNQLTGTIPDELAQLTNLSLLFLNDNKLTGSIPTVLAQLGNLRYLYLRGNMLTGPIPVELVQLTRLNFLDFGQNQLSGSIPVELGQMTSLQWFLLDNNQLTGTIPGALGQLTNLSLLYLNGNQLSGSVPTELANLTQLIYLDLGQNQLTGSFPDVLVNINSLQKLDLAQNQLTGTIPVEIVQLTNLQWLSLDRNQLTGSIPVELAQLANLSLLYLNGNQLTGTIPVELAQLTFLKWLSLGQNLLTGSIPTALGQLTNLSLLYLSGNQLTGTIPVELGQLTNLQWFDLGNNQLTGAIPVELGQLTNLSLLYLNANQLTDSIPSEIGQLANLQWLSFDQNQLTGSIPSEIRQMNRLKYLEVQYNQLDSLPDLTIPDSLISFDISDNKLSFEDLENNMDLNPSLSFYYSPQDSIGENLEITKERGESFSYNLVTGGTQNNYQWYKNGGMLSTQTSAKLNIDDLKRGNSGKYYCQVTNTEVPDLTLFSRVISLMVNDTTETCVKLSFIAGWNMFSSPVMPDSADLKTIFQPLIDNNSLVKIQDELGNSLENWKIFGGWQNNIGDIEPTEGYRIKLNFADSLEICGLQTEFPYAIPLQPGWNIMGYPQLIAFDGMDVVQQLINRGTLVKVQDELGNSIENWKIFGGWQNNIGEFIPGKGYKIKVNAKDTLWINESYPKSSVHLKEKSAPLHFIPEFNGNGVDHMNINLVGLPVNVLNAGDELAIFDGENCVGTVVLMPNNLKSKMVSVVASANDNLGMKGFSEGNPFILKLWKSKQNQEYILEPEIIAGASVFVKNETTMASLEKYLATGFRDSKVNINVINCYPNPFNNEVTIELNIPNEAKAEVDVMNQLGQKVKSLATEDMLNRGTTRLKWNGTDTSNQLVSTGVYYVRIKLDGEMQVKKVVYRKFD